MGAMLPIEPPVFTRNCKTQAHEIHVTDTFTQEFHIPLKQYCIVEGSYIGKEASV